MTCICESASQSSLFDNRTKVVFRENSSATGSDTCWARIGNVKSTAALGLPKNTFKSIHRKNEFFEIWKTDCPKKSISRKTRSLVGYPKTFARKIYILWNWEKSIFQKIWWFEKTDIMENLIVRKIDSPKKRFFRKINSPKKQSIWMIRKFNASKNRWPEKSEYLHFGGSENFCSGPAVHGIRLIL